MGIIYILTSPEYKSYIGQTIQTFNKRLNDHKNGKPYCRKLKEAIDIFGLDKFKALPILFNAGSFLCLHKFSMALFILSCFCFSPSFKISFLI